MAGRLICQKRLVKKTPATIVNIHIHLPFYVMYFIFYNYDSPLELYRTSNALWRCDKAGAGLSLAEENVLYSATLDMSNGVKINESGSSG